MASNETDLEKALSEATAYPLLTREIDTGLGTAAGSSPAGTSINRLAGDAIRQALGWRYRKEDPKGFTAALNKAFALRETEGQIVWNWKPQNFTLQADLGEVTGAQASILARARAAVNEARPLLDGLKPLSAVADEGDMLAVRAIVDQLLANLIEELSQPGGPRVQRVDMVFKQLLGPNPNLKNPEKVDGRLGTLQERFVLHRSQVNTIEEEQNLTNFLILVDYTNSLFQTWQAQRPFFDRRGNVQPFLGTQLVRISQQLEVIAESVREAYALYDSVFFGPAERGTTTLNLNHETPITLSELLSWVEDFATSEGIGLIQEAGKDGVVAFRETLHRLVGLLEKAQALAAKPPEDRDAAKAPNLPSNLPKAFHSERGRMALQGVLTNLRQAEILAGQILRLPPPLITSVRVKKLTTEKGAGGTKFKLVLIFDGEGFQEDLRPYINPPGTGDLPAESYFQALGHEKRIEAFTIDLDKWIPGKVLHLRGSRQFIAEFDLDAVVLGGAYDAGVRNPDRQEHVLEAAFTVIADSSSGGRPPLPKDK